MDAIANITGPSAVMVISASRYGWDCVVVAVKVDLSSEVLI